MDITLVMLPQWNISQPPLGIAYLTAFLRSRGVSAEQRDFSAELLNKLPKEKKYIMESRHHLNWINSFYETIYPEIETAVNQWVRELASNPSGIIAFSVFSTNKIITLDIAGKVKRKNPKKIIVMGGPQVTRYEDGLEIIKNSFVDYIVTGEGEETLYELVRGIKNGSDIKEKKGVLFRENGQIIDTGERPAINPLDKLPFPSLSDFLLECYKDLMIPIVTSRGCVNRCTYCAERVFWKNYRFRSAENVYTEIKHQHDTLGKNSFYIVDSLINGNMKELERLCDLIIKDNTLRIYWGGKAAIRPEMTRGILQKLYKAGNRSIVYGIESGSDKVLQDMGKRFDIELTTKVIKETHESGIAVGTFWIIGFPTEKEEDFEETIRFIRTNKAYIDIVTPGYGCGILKGSELFINYRKYGIEFKENGWYSSYTTPEIRDTRLKRFKEECSHMNIRMD